MNTYRVTLTHEDLDGPFVADLMASSETTAAIRVRAAAMHHYRHVPLLSAHCEVEIIEAAE